MLPKSPWCRKRSYHSIAAAGLALTGGLVLLLATSLAQAEDAAILTDAEAMTALSAPPSESRICQKLSSRLERMCQRNNLPDANAALCARIEEGLPGLCGKLDRILATPAAGGRLLAALAEDFSLELVDEKSDLRDSALHPLILTPEDLEEREITDYLAASYASGMTVAIVGANQEEANLFHNLAGAAGSANCAPDEGSLAITFYGLHRSIERQPPVVSSYCLPGSIDIEDEEERAQLRDYFAPEYPLALAESQTGNAAGATLEDLATMTHCQATFTGLNAPKDPNTKEPLDFGAQMSVDAFIRSVRNFSNDRDFYDVNVFAKYKGSAIGGPRDMKVISFLCDPNIVGLPCFPSGAVGAIVASSPKAASSTSSYQKSFDFSTSGGFRRGSGIGGATLLAARTGLAIAKAANVGIAPSKISVKHSLGSAFLNWEFQPKPNLPKRSLFSPEARWLWSYERDQYADDGTTNGGQQKALISLSFRPYSGLNFGSIVETRELLCNMPYPWPRWEVDNPVIEAASPATVRVGENFLIKGSGFYDGIVEQVVMGGKVVPRQLFRVLDEDTIRITVPFDQPTQSAAPIQVTTKFDGRPLDSNRDITVEITDPLIQ